MVVPSTAKEKKSAYDRAYIQRPEVRARRRAYLKAYGQRPEVKAKLRDYSQRSDVKEKKRIWTQAYNQRPEIRERHRNWMRTYRQSPGVRDRERARMRVYNATHRRQEQNRAYRARPEVRKRDREYMRVRRQEPIVRERELNYARRYQKRDSTKTRQRLWQKQYRRRNGSDPRRKTRPEAAMELLLSTHFPGDWKYTGQGDVTLGGCAPDFFNVNGKKAIIEVYGCYWHNCPTCGLKPSPLSPEHDAKRLQMFEEMGYKTLVVWEHELEDSPRSIHRIQNEVYTTKSGDGL